MSAAEKALRDDEANALFDVLKFAWIDPRRLRRAGFDGAARLAARWAENSNTARTTRAETPRGDGRPRPAAASRDRGLGGEAPGAPPRRAASHAALARQEARHRAARGGALRALSAARAKRPGAPAMATSSPPIPSTIRRRRCCFASPAAAGSRGLPAWPAPRRLPVGGERIVLAAAVSHVRQGAPGRDARSRRHRLCDDPSNRDPRFTRARLRALMPALAREGLDAGGLARLSARARRADATVEFAVDAARAALAPGPWRARGPIVFATARSAACRPRWRCACSAAPSTMSATRGRSNSAKLEALYVALARPTRRCGAPWPGHW